RPGHLVRVRKKWGTTGLGKRRSARGPVREWMKHLDTRLEKLKEAVVAETDCANIDQIAAGIRRQCCSLETTVNEREKYELEYEYLKGHARLSQEVQTQQTQQHLQASSDEGSDTEGIDVG